MARYDSLRKIERNRQLVNDYQVRPDLTLKQLGWSFNLSPQRVLAIIRAEEKRLGHKLKRGEPSAQG